MIEQSLRGKRICVLVDHKYIPEEIEGYRTGFALYGAQVEFVSRIWWGDYKPDGQYFFSDVDPLDNEPWESPQRLRVTRDVSTVDLRQYAAILMSANYTSVRLRWEGVPQHPPAQLDTRLYVQSPPAVRLFGEAMRNPKIVKGALCHGLWILTASPDLLKGRKVTCHTVVMADVLNCRAEVQFVQDATGRTSVAPVVVDGDLVTGYSKHELLLYIQAVADTINTI